MPELKLYGFPPSTYVQTARLAATELDASYELAPLEFKKPSHFRLHPYGKMPVLEHGDVRLFETMAIVSYVDRVFGKSKLSPDDPEQHARMLQWVSVAVDYAYPDLVKGLLGDDAPGADAVTAAGEGLKLLDAALADSAWFAGSELSQADLFVYPMVEFAVRKLGVDSIDGLANLTRWRAAMASRSSVKQVMAA